MKKFGKAETVRLAFGLSKLHNFLTSPFKKPPPVNSLKSGNNL